MSDTLLPREFAGGRLRRLCSGDRPAFQAYRSLPELGRYQDWPRMSDADAEIYLRKAERAPLFTPDQWVQLGIAEPEGDLLLGDIGLYLSGDETFGQIGYTLQPTAQGRGLASRAVREAIALLFEATKVTRVRAMTDERNTASIRLLERVGFNLTESRLVAFRNEQCRELVYTMLRHGGQPIVSAPVTPGVEFPLVRLQPYTPEWAAAYAAEKARISAVLGNDILAIEHVGSTAVPGLSAKPIVDIAIAVRSLELAEAFAPAMASIGYDYAGDGGVPGERIYGRPPRARTHLVHMVIANSAQWRSYIRFRDALRADETLARDYDQLKAALAAEFPNDRPSYTRGKGQFIENTLRRTT